MNKYYKNFILCGDIDQYCLLCKETFQRIPDIEKHIRWEKHRKNIKELTSLTKFREDLIHKIGSKYYCEICNLIEANMKSIKEHIQCEKHISLKRNPSGTKKPVGLFQCGFVLIDKIILTRAQWHSIIDGKCRICNKSVTNIDEHIALEEHIVKLILCEAKYSENQYYRKINEEIYHCFACKTIVLAADFNNHMTNCKNVDESEVIQLRDTKLANIQKFTESVSCIEAVEHQLLKTFEEFFIISLTNNVAVCKICYVSVTADFKSLLIHLKEYHNKQTEPSTSGRKRTPKSFEIVDHGKKRSELSKYGKENHIRLNHNATKGYCLICDKYFIANKKVFEEHCRGLSHRGHEELLGLREPELNRTPVVHPKQNMKSFVTTVQYETRSQTAIINNEFYVEMNSFLLVNPIENDPHFAKSKCFVCNVLIDKGSELEHCFTLEHRNKFVAVLVLVKPMEFVREIRPNLFHCGFCHVTLPFLKSVDIHLQRLNHKNERDSKMLINNDENVEENFAQATGLEGHFSNLLQEFCQSTKF